MFLYWSLCDKEFFASLFIERRAFTKRKQLLFASAE